MKSTQPTRWRAALAAAAQSGLPFPFAPGDVAQFESISTALRERDGAVSIVYAHPERNAHDVTGLMYRVTCLNGGARNGVEFDAYESELSR